VAVRSKQKRKARPTHFNSEPFEVAFDGYVINPVTNERRLAPCAVEDNEGGITCSSPTGEVYDGPYWFGKATMVDGEPFVRGLHRSYYSRRCGRCGIVLENFMGEVDLPAYYDHAYWSAKHGTFAVKEGVASGG